MKNAIEQGIWKLHPRWFFPSLSPVAVHLESPRCLQVLLVILVHEKACSAPMKRLVVTEFNNIVLDTGTNYQVLDIAEAGELQSIVIVADNPYLQVFVQIDDFRNAEPNGMTVAELLYNGNLTQMSQRRFRPVDGQSPTVGYAMVFEPQNPVQYTERLRIILYNNIPRNTNVYGMDLSFRNSATLPTPAVPAHMAGATFEQSSLAGCVTL